MKVCLDLDETVADLITPWMEWLHENNFSTVIHKHEEILSYDWMFVTYGERARDFFLQDPNHTYKHKVNPIPGSKSFIKKLNKYDFHFLTHACKLETKEAKTNFIKYHYDLSDKYLQTMEVLHDKYLFTKDTILIDDYPYHLIKHIQYNKCPAIVFDYKGKYGWSKLENYKHLITEDFDPNLYYTATSYNEVLNILGVLL